MELGTRTRKGGLGRPSGKGKAPAKPNPKPAAKPTGKGKAPAAPKGKPKAVDKATTTTLGMAFKASIGKHDYVIRAIKMKPETWEIRKNGKVLSELGRRELAQQLCLRDAKCANPSGVKWTRVEDKRAGTESGVMTDHTFREEMRHLGEKLGKADRAVSLKKKELEGIKAKLKDAENEREVIVREMHSLARDESIGQSRLNLTNPASKKGVQSTKAPAPKPDGKGKASPKPTGKGKAAPKKKVAPKKVAAKKTAAKK